MVRHPPDHAAERERFVEDLLAIMSAAEKAGQLVLLPIPEAGGDSEGAPLRAEMLQGRVGGLLGSGAADQLAALQRLAVEETRLGIPLLMANVPGRGTSVTMPAPLALAATWSPHIVESAAQIVAGEARAHGMNWLMGPQVVLTSDTETEELAESWGTSVHLARALAAATVRGLQFEGQDGDGVLACLRTDAPGWIERRDPDILTDKLRLVAGVLREIAPGEHRAGSTRADSA
ncbi:glycoside hydrolase family 3 N-terminal domain-containing protein [Qipengyuania sp. GPGPB31]|uniref:glycoside hydrolase family 3 N-terminal domain-containing protein n=1 Tax=Qipengyuania sp. GPGPB31 TaxID=3023518 RepID=UPI0031342678